MAATNTIEEPAANVNASGPNHKVNKVLLATIFAITFIQYSSFSLMFPVLPILNTKLNGGAYSMGLLVSIYSVSRFASVLIAGPLSDRFGRPIFVYAAMLICALAYMGHGLANQLWILHGCRFLLGLAAGVVPVLLAYISVLVPQEDLATYQGYASTFGSVGMSFGPAIGGILYQFLGVAGACYVPAAVCTLGFVAAFVLLREPQDAAEEKDKIEHTCDSQDTQVTSAQTTKCEILLRVLPVSLSGAFWWAHNSIIEAQGLVYFESILSMSGFELGMYFTIVGTVSAVCGFVAPGPLVKRYGARAANAYACIAPVVGCTMLGVARTPWMPWVVAVSLGVSLLNQPLQAVMLTELSTTNVRGTVMGIGQAFGSLGRIFGPLVGAAIYEVGPANIFYASAVFAGLAAIVPFASCPRQSDVKEAIVEDTAAAVDV